MERELALEGGQEARERKSKVAERKLKVINIF